MPTFTAIPTETRMMPITGWKEWATRKIHVFGVITFGDGDTMRVASTETEYWGPILLEVEAGRWLDIGNNRANTERIAAQLPGSLVALRMWMHDRYAAGIADHGDPPGWPAFDLLALGDRATWDALVEERDARREASRVERVAKEEARKTREAEAAKAGMAATVAAAKAGRRLTGNEIVDVARHLGIDVHPRTVGSIRKSLRWMEGPAGPAMAAKGWAGSESARALYSQIVEVLNPSPTEAMDYEKAKALFVAGGTNV